MTVPFNLYLPAELRRIASLEAKRLEIPLSEFFVRAAAEKLGRIDLLQPRRVGRPRKEFVAK